MAQVDFVNYFSILFWFFLLFVIYYIINYTVLLPNIYSIITIRYNIYNKAVNNLKLKVVCYIKKYSFYIAIKNSYIFFLLFLKKCIYIW